MQDFKAGDSRKGWRQDSWDRSRWMGPQQWTRRARIFANAHQRAPTTEMALTRHAREYDSFAAPSPPAASLDDPQSPHTMPSPSLRPSMASALRGKELSPANGGCQVQGSACSLPATEFAIGLAEASAATGVLPPRPTPSAPQVCSPVPLLQAHLSLSGSRGT